MHWLGERLNSQTSNQVNSVPTIILPLLKGNRAVPLCTALHNLVKHFLTQKIAHLVVMILVVPENTESPRSRLPCNPVLEIWLLKFEHLSYVCLNM